ncbi:MAG: hypothetical protein QOJ09_2280, partial [Actinomycetota bacterium]|nr:hypothetical protein [Actinomycetota bacterium]
MLDRRGLVVLALTCAIASLLAPGAASAAADGIPVTDVSWYNAAQPAAPAGAPVAPPKAPAPDVPTGDFAVASQLGQVTRESFLHIDTSAIPAGSTVGSLVLTVKEDGAGGNLNAAAAAVQAVPATGFFSGGVAGAPIAEAPSVDAAAAVDGKRGADGAWTFEIGPIVGKWLDGSLANNGIGIVPKVDPANPFQVVFSG